MNISHICVDVGAIQSAIFLNCILVVIFLQLFVLMCLVFSKALCVCVREKEKVWIKVLSMQGCTVFRGGNVASPAGNLSRC